MRNLKATSKRPQLTIDGIKKKENKKVPPDMLQMLQISG